MQPLLQVLQCDVISRVTFTLLFVRLWWSLDPRRKDFETVESGELPPSGVASWGGWRYLCLVPAGFPVEESSQQELSSGRSWWI